MKLKKILAMAAVAVFGGVSSVSAQEVTWPLPYPSTALTDIGITISSEGETLDPVGGWYYMLNGNGTYATLNAEHKLESSTTNAEPIFLNTATSWSPEVWLVSTEGYVYMPGKDTWSTLANGGGDAANRFWKYTVSNGKYKLNNQAKHKNDNLFLAPNDDGAGQTIYANKTAYTEWALVPAYKASLIARMNKYYSAYIDGKSTPEATALKTSLEAVYNDIKDIKITNENYNKYFERIQYAIAKVNANELLVNPGFETCSIGGWTNDGDVKLGHLSSNPDYNPKTGRWFVEKYGSTGSIDFNQTTPEVPSGVYKVGVSARNATGVPVYVYGNSSQSEIGVNTTKYYANVYLKNDGTIKLGVKGENNPAEKWFAIDDFTLEYLGNPINLAASALSSEAVIADDWYKYDIKVEGDYIITSTVAATIKYTQDGDQDADAAGTTDVVFTVGESKTIEGLAVGTLYVKATAATTITIEPVTKSYTVGSATADITSIQGNKVVKVSYNDVITNDDKASFAINGTPAITFAGNAITVNPTANGFTFTVPADVTVGQTYALSIPANAFGYAAGNTYNEAQNIKFTTPAVFDGNFFMWNTDTETYLSRGAGYGTQAHLDEYGLPVNLTTDGNGNTTIKYIDSNLPLGFDGFCYTDANNDNVRTFKITKVGDNYKFLNTNNNNYLAVKEGNAVADAVEGVNLQGTSNVWALEDKATHAVKMDALKSALTIYNDDEYNLTNVEFEAIAKGETYQAKKDDITKTLTDIENGIYKVSVQAYQRFTGHAVTWQWNDAKVGNIYFYAGDKKVQLCGLFDQTNPSTTKRQDTDVLYGGNYYPDRTAGGDAAFEAGNYWNVLYVEVTDGNLTFGINDPSIAAGDWVYYDNFKVEKLSKASATMSCTAGKFGTFCAPFDVVLPGDVKAYSAAVEGNYVKLTQIKEAGETLTAGTPAIIYSEAGLEATTLFGKATVEDATCTDGVLTGILTEAGKEVPANAYVLNTNNGVQGFYKVSTAANGVLNRCYLNAPAAAKGGLSIVFDDDNTTAVAGVSEAKAKPAVMKYMKKGQLIIETLNGKVNAAGAQVK